MPDYGIEADDLGLTEADLGLDLGDDRFEPDPATVDPVLSVEGSELVVPPDPLTAPDVAPPPLTVGGADRLEGHDGR